MGDTSADPGRLLAQMTLPEKVGQLTMITGEWAQTGPKAMPVSVDAIRAGAAGSILNLWSPDAVRAAQRAAVEGSRLGIPLLVGFDVVHGHRTIFPVPLAEAAAFDPDLWQRTAAAAASEAAADGIGLTFAPMLDVARDPRWGRICEGPGESPVLAARWAAAKVRGFQGAALADPARIAATAKHLGAYGAVAAGRDYASADPSPRDLAEVHLPAFAAAVQAGVAAIMPAFNDIAGQPATAHTDLLQGWLRGGQGFGGVVISDYNAIAELVVHGVAADLAEAAALALRAGVDIDMMGGAYQAGLVPALARGLVTMDQIDAAVLRVLALKQRLGLFADPFRGLGADAPPAGVRFRALAREAAGKAMVLLKNEGAVLPLTCSGGPIAVIGPLADAAEEMLGAWSGAGRAEDCVTFRAGLAAGFPDRALRYAEGAGIESGTAAMIAAAVATAQGADTVLLCAGEARAMSGEASCRGAPVLPEPQLDLARALIASGRPVVLILCSGRPLILPDWLVAGCAAILAAWFPGAEAGHALADVLSGARAPTGRLPVTWPAAIGQIPIHHALRRSGRPASADHYTSKYLDIPVEPLFPFGHGLSYASPQIEALRAEPATVDVPGQITLRFELVNPASQHVETTVLVYRQDPVASIARPVLELCGFVRVQAAPGERVPVSLTFGTDVAAFPGADLAPRVETGRIDFLLGTRAVEAELARVSVHLRGGLPHILPQAEQAGPVQG
ncbi:beta-glucosidase [Rhodobacter veldkampii DSM 11550]|nr:glycoside hydrolase family 3 N-terminal domain-containing protein [Phaeovulum veldkampii]MBK5945112.1 beta-glucosidase [Phaeovulum veldkampii DSM 11550]TDQ64563.1 beta-glucosidase [Phaeovulum veldkampii DSM 11550]